MIGKWGIARDPNGELASIYEWKWPWRYAVMALGLTATALTVYYLLETKPNQWWLALVAACVGVLASLSVAYELGCLALVLAFYGAIYLAVDHFFPTNTWEAPRWLIWAIAILVMYSINLKFDKLAKIIDKQAEDLNQLRWRVNELEARNRYRYDPDEDR